MLILLKHSLMVAFILLMACNNAQTTKEEITEHKVYRSIEENTIINLYDAFGENKEGMTMDFGFSCILKFKGQTILFDAGTNADIFKKNVEALNIDLREVDFAVASHAHFDHINGFDYLLEVNPEVKIYFPFDLFWGANIPFNLAGQDSTAVDSLDQKMQYFNGKFESYRFNQTGRFWKANIVFVKESGEIAPGIKLIKTSSPFMGYFSKYPNVAIGSEDGHMHENKEGKPKLVELNELSMALSTEKGEIVFVGCSHSTIEKIVIETKAFTANDIRLAYGGYHLLPYDRRTLKQLANRLKEKHKVEQVAPAHCTGHLAFQILQDTYQENYVYAGLGKITPF